MILTAEKIINKALMGKMESIIGKSAKGIVLDKKSPQLVVWQLCREIKDACNDLPV